MSLIIMKRKFEAVPASTDIMQLLFGTDSGDRDKAKDALQAFLTPVKDLLDLLYLVDQMKATTERHVELLKEQEAIAAQIAADKVALAAGKVAFDKTLAAQTVRLGELKEDIAGLEKAKSSLEDEQSVRDRMNQAIVKEVEATKKELLAGIDKEVSKAKEKLTGLNASITAAEQELANLEEKKRQFIASLGG